MTDVNDYAHFNIRCEKSLRETAEQHARSQGQSLAEWIRRAMQDKIDREINGVVSADERIKALEEKVEAMQIYIKATESEKESTVNYGADEENKR